MIVNLTIFAGKEKNQDYNGPFLIGGFNTDYLADLDQETHDDLIQDLKKQWTGQPDAYEWREVRVAVAMDKIGDLFDTPEISGTIV